MNILILSGRFGMGHNSAARAITEDINNIDKNINVNTVDLVAYMYPGTCEVIYKGFNKVVNKYHELYNMIYKISEKLEMDMKLSSTGTNRKMNLLLEIYKPDIIISTLPLCARTISAYKDMNKIDIPLITCVTDISMHKEWMAPNTDVYFVPTKSIKENLIKNGVDKEKIFVVGIPVKDEFKNLPKIKTSEKNVLIMGGGLGLLPNLDSLMDRLENIPNLKTTIITGTNKKAYDELLGKYKNTEIVGFTDKVSEYMNRADFMISKAGGITLFESIYSQTPIFVIKPFLAQEIRNAKFIEDNLIGKVIWNDKEDIGESLSNLLFNEIKLKQMKNNMETLKSRVIEDDLKEVIEKLFKKCVA